MISSSSRTPWRPTMCSTNGSNKSPPQIPIPIPSQAATASSDLAATLSRAEALRALGLHHAASILDVASQKAIARNDSPTSLLDHLVREELRIRAQVALKRSAIFP